MDIKESMKNFVEAEEIYFEAKKDLLIALSENMPNPFMSVNYTAVRREVELYREKLNYTETI